jgi:hypothetical protein
MIALEYSYDLRIPPLPNKTLQGFATDLDIENSQFYRTHWSVKDACRPLSNPAKELATASSATDGLSSG